MLLDARAVADGSVLDADVCVVGAGPAGITVAKELAALRHRVVVLETGGAELDERYQAVNDGITLGPRHEGADYPRVRAFGGTTHVWGGWARPLDRDDFEERDWIPYSGWPFAREHLDPFYARARRICGLGDNDNGPASATALSVCAEALASEISFQIAPIRFGAAHAADLRDAPNVRVVLHATAMSVAVGADGRTAESVRATTVYRNQFRVIARVIVLAAGGVENPRLLLSSPEGGSHGLGNEHGLIGCFFADHLHVPIGTLRTSAPAALERFLARRVTDTSVRGGITLRPDVRRRERLLGSALTLHNAADPHDVLSPARTRGGYHSLVLLLRSLQRRRAVIGLPTHVANVMRNMDEALFMSYRKLLKPEAKVWTIGARAEQAPDVGSRLVLEDHHDQFGVRRARVEWRVTDQDLDSLHASQRAYARALFGFDVDMLPRDGPTGWSGRITPGAHHIGTTRMHESPTRGVVDAQCRVHATSNVYVAGSSVFPTGGWAPPTLTIIALALRLADHVATRLDGRSSPARGGDV